MQHDFTIARHNQVLSGYVQLQRLSPYKCKNWGACAAAMHEIRGLQEGNAVETLCNYLPGNKAPHRLDQQDLQ